MHTHLSAAAGQWSGANTLHDPHTGKPETTESIMRIEPVLGGRFHRLAYTWAYQGKPQEGEMLIGIDGDHATLSWVDTWHQSKRVMLLTGDMASSDRVSVRGTFPAPPGPDWGWSIDVDVAPSRVVMTMTCYEPDGTPTPAVDAAWNRPASA